MDEHDSASALPESDFLALLVKHEPALRAYARHLVPDWELVDEAIQEASITMWQKRGQLGNVDGFVPWARTVLRFKCLRQLETLRSRRAVLSTEVVEMLADRTPKQPAADTSVRGKALQTCLSQFSVEHRELLLAAHSTTVSIVDLANRREKTPNALYKLLARLRQQLTQCIDLRIANEVDS